MLIRSPSRGLSNVVSFTNVTRSTTVVSFPPMGDLPTVGDLPDIGDIGGGGFISYTDGSGDFFTDDGSLIDSSGGFTSDWGGSGGDGGYTSYDDQAQVIFASDTSDFDGPADDEAQDGGGNRKATFWDAFWKGFNDSLNTLLSIIGLGIGPTAPGNTLPSNARTTTDAEEVFKRLNDYSGIDPNLASQRLHDIKTAA